MDTHGHTDKHVHTRTHQVRKIFWVTFSFQGVLCTFNLLPVVIPLSAFATYISLYGELNAVTVFRTMAYFQGLQV